MRKNVATVFCTFMLTFSAIGAELKFVTQDVPPFVYKVDEQVSGPVADVIREVCKQMEITCSFKMLPWARAQLEAKKGDAQGIFIVGWNEERSKWLTYSPPLLNSQYGFFVRRENPLEYQQLADIAGQNVGVFGVSNSSNSLEKLRKQMIELNLEPIKIIMTYDDIFIFRMLSSGGRNMGLVYSNREVGHAIIRQEKIKNVRYAGEQKKLKYYIGFSQKNTDREVVDRFNKTLREMHKADTIQKILDKYHMEAAELE